MLSTYRNSRDLGQQTGAGSITYSSCNKSLFSFKPEAAVSTHKLCKAGQPAHIQKGSTPTFHNTSGMSSNGWAIASSKMARALSFSPRYCCSNSANLHQAVQLAGLHSKYFSYKVRTRSMFPSCLSICTNTESHSLLCRAPDHVAKQNSQQHHFDNIPVLLIIATSRHCVSLKSKTCRTLG